MNGDLAQNDDDDDDDDASVAASVVVAAAASVAAAAAAAAVAVFALIVVAAAAAVVAVVHDVIIVLFLHIHFPILHLVPFAFTHFTSLSSSTPPPSPLPSPLNPVCICCYLWQFVGCRVRKQVQRRSPKNMEGLCSVVACRLIVDRASLSLERSPVCPCAREYLF